MTTPAGDWLTGARGLVREGGTLDDSSASTSLRSVHVFILLLPPVLPPERPMSPPGPRVELTPGVRITATVLAPDLHGRSLMHFAGRDVASHTPLPFPPGTRLTLEVVEGGESPSVRVLWPAGIAPHQPSVSTRTYGLAAAVLAARGAPDPLAAWPPLARWLPLLVSRGLISAAHAAALNGALGPVRSTGVPRGASAQAEILADALAARLAQSGVWLERQLAQALRQGTAAPLASGVTDARQLLAALARALAHAEGGETATARAAVTTLQQAQLAEQARTAAHFARDGSLDVRVPLQVATEDIELRLRVSDDPPPADEANAPLQRLVRLDVQVAGLGRLQVALGWAPGHLRAEVFTETAAAADAIEAGLGDLTSALDALGYHHVLTRVVVDPVRVFADDDVPDLPAEGTILSADA